MGLKDPVVDQLVEQLINADSRKSLVAHARALDRVLQWGYYVMPNWHIKTWRVAYWNHIGHPKISPKYDIGIDHLVGQARRQACGRSRNHNCKPTLRARSNQMLAYIFRRLLLIIPTLFGILLINFVIIQAAPGGPVEQMIAKLEGFEGATSRIAGGGAEVSVAGSAYRGAQGLDPALIKEIEHMYGFDKSAPERLWIMVKNYAHPGFRRQLLPRRQGHRPDQGKDAGVDLPRAVEHADHVPGVDPAGDRQGHAARQPLRRLDQFGDHRRLRDPGVPVRHPADRGVRRRQLPGLVPLARADLEQLR